MASGQRRTVVVRCLPPVQSLRRRGLHPGRPGTRERPLELGPRRTLPAPDIPVLGYRGMTRGGQETPLPDRKDAVTSPEDKLYDIHNRPADWDLRFSMIIGLTIQTAAGA